MNRSEFFSSKGFQFTSVEAAFALNESFYQKLSLLTYTSKNWWYCHVRQLIERKQNSYISLMLCWKKNCLLMHHLTNFMSFQSWLTVKNTAVKCQLRSKVTRSNVTFSQTSHSQLSRGQMSVAVKCPESNVPRSNVSCCQMASGQLLWMWPFYQKPSFLTYTSKNW